MPPESMRARFAKQASTDFASRAGRLQDALIAMDSQDNITVGKYLISPLTRVLANGWYACSVSIRSGSGSGTHDRVLRLTRLFRSKVAAVAYATTEGLQWIGHSGRSHSACAPVSH
jgi:phage gp46-like protein